MATGERIKQLRVDRGLSQMKMARALGLSRFTITGWENDKRIPHWANLQQLAEYFGVSVKFLLYGENGPQAAHSRPSEPEAGQDTGESI
ncbi:hypothetical protein LCGC14_1183590 [marine sediment metagenome]|uniref:HTH cro/C1-type domain-containing protein n=1 Tax=marine sediment metagenome TaxID=412755 RepID=A0A0F9PRX8_9ZZZZ